jgi:three-Cys-motif partner protein
MALDPDKYEPDDDGLPREIVGPWVREKHARLERYVSISRGPRRKFIGAGKAGATFIDLYSGPGRARIDDTQTVIDGSPLVAWRTSDETGSAFTAVHIADAEPVLVDACHRRLEKAKAPVSSEAGLATATVDRVISRLNPYGLHFAFLDPYNLAAIPFEVIRKLAAIKRMDILVHVSVQDLQRNLPNYMRQKQSPLDDFAPGWREQIDDTQDQHLIRAKVLAHWRRLLADQGMTTAEAAELVTGPKNQRLYWLAFAARHSRALYFWEQIRELGGQRSLL